MKWINYDVETVRALALVVSTREGLPRLDGCFCELCGGVVNAVDLVESDYVKCVSCEHEQIAYAPMRVSGLVRLEYSAVYPIEDSIADEIAAAKKKRIADRTDEEKMFASIPASAITTENPLPQLLEEA